MSTHHSRRQLQQPGFLAALVALAGISLPLRAAPPGVNEAPAGRGEWGFRPAEEAWSPVNPPPFSWRPQPGALDYELECARDDGFGRPAYRARDITENCHCPPEAFAPGKYFWRFRYTGKGGERSAWSRPRSFAITARSAPFPMPRPEDLLARIPGSHPRLFLRPEDLPGLRRQAEGRLKASYAGLVNECDRLMKRPPPTAEPPKYDPGTLRGSDPWRKVWWGNRTYTIRLLNGAATLGFTRLLGGHEPYGQLARKLLLAAAQWDPAGSTGYRYNDEAGMPYCYYFARTYTFIQDLLTEEERRLCRAVMRARGQEIYRHLYPRHLWRPYSSHSNRAWHFLGEAGIAFYGEIPEAGEWVRFATTVFFCTYPVWSDADGGWHEGSGYWCSYLSRFTWWADVMRSALRIDAYRKPYFSQVGYYPIYLQPPGPRGGGFGDLNAKRTSRSNRALMSVLAAEAQNPHWQWYVEAHGDPPPAGGYVGFVRGALPPVSPRRPDDLPTSRLFRGTGLAFLNTDLTSAANNVALQFKSSPFGTQSHGYESQNAFLLYAYGERLLIRTGFRDSYGSTHHRKWMWETKSVNSITVDGEGQGTHSAAAAGEVALFHTSEEFDFVRGEAGAAYGDRLDRFTRDILFIKPDLLVIYDKLEAPRPAAFGWHLHAPAPMKVEGQSDIRVASGKAACEVAFLAPPGLQLDLTDQFDPPPRERVKLTEWHLTATTREKARRAGFLTVIRPHRAGEKPVALPAFDREGGGYTLRAELGDGSATIRLRPSGGKGTGDEIFASRHTPHQRGAKWLRIRRGELLAGKDSPGR